MLSEVGTTLASTVAPPAGAPIMELNAVGNSLVARIEQLQKQLKTITSSNNYTT